MDPAVLARFNSMLNMTPTESVAYPILGNSDVTATANVMIAERGIMRSPLRARRCPRLPNAVAARSLAWEETVERNFDRMPPKGNGSVRADRLRACDKASRSRFSGCEP